MYAMIVSSGSTQVTVLVTHGGINRGSSQRGIAICDFNVVKSVVSLCVTVYCSSAVLEVLCSSMVTE